ncbi:MAG: hypothetical protein QOJ80_5222 [Mycobacterium sp.]|nr:hypothetical protein [Mycobacterium sp.]
MMDHIHEEDFPEVGKASHAVCQEAADAGVFVFSGGLDYENDDVEHALVGTDGVITDGPFPESKELIGGVLVVDVPTREAALTASAMLGGRWRRPARAQFWKRHRGLGRTCPG